MTSAARWRAGRAAVCAATTAAAATAATAHAQSTPDDGARIDSVFRAYGPAGPGCSVGVSRRGAVVLARAYGMADLEHDVPNGAATIFEAGSVSKQVTAASIVLLALDGKLSLDDDVRRFLPELPTYDAPITIRHLLTHTSGLRDWGSVAAIGGWPRGTRRYTNELALDITRRQRALNYTPGRYYSYTNTGYNLLALIVGRVAGVPLAEFSRTRLFAPLGMTSTSWRDDFTRVVPGRAVAYEPAGRGAFRQEMPFEDAYGNGGLLTTPSDLLRWTANLETGAVVGGAPFVEAMHRQARLTSGRTIEYASGIVVTTYRGVREVSHSGSTAGYRAYLSRYPDQAAAVAVLCNVANANATSLAHQVADVVLGDALAPRTASPRAATLPPARARTIAGTYRSTRDGQSYRLVATDSGLRTAAGALLAATDADGTRLTTPGGATLVFDASASGARAAFRLVGADGDTVRYEPVPAFAPTAAQLAAYAGRYTSDEADNTLAISAADGVLTVRDRYGRALGRLTPLYPDAFEGPGFDVRFVRDAAQRVTGLDVREARVWALRFARMAPGAGAGRTAALTDPPTPHP